jgi:alcohol dehydrogenase YqhD (iron-dependent ADH family)
MLDFQWVSPTEFVFGHDAESKVGEWVASHGFKKAMVTYGKGSVIRSGLLDRVKKSLDDAGVSYVELGGIRPNPEVASAREGIRIAKAEGVDIMIPVGGGSVIDCSKAIAVGTLYDGDVWDLYDKSNPATPTDGLPLAVVLTIPATGSEASDSSVLSNDELHLKSGTHGLFNRPKVAFMDPELTETLPPYQTAAGITDICAHIFERYFSSTGDTAVSDGIAIALLRAIRSSAYRVMRDPHDYDARAEIMWAGTLAHNGICARGRDEDWVSHGMEHELSASDTSVTHGAGLAVIMPAWMRYVCRERPRRFVRLGAEVFGLVTTGDDLADAYTTIDRIQGFFCDLGMPRYLDDFGFTPADIDAMIPRLLKNKGGKWPIGSFMKLYEKDIRAIYQSAFKPQE